LEWKFALHNVHSWSFMPQTHFSLDEANDRITVSLARMNGHIMRRLGLSRRFCS